jgi:hypothetical protein
LFKKFFLIACTLFCLRAFSDELATGIILPDLGEPDAPLVTPKPLIQEQPSSIPLGASSIQRPDSAGLAGTGVLPNSQSQSIRIGDVGAGASIGASNTDFRFEGKDYLGHIGMEYASPNSSYGYGLKADGAALISSTFAVGANLTGYSNLREAVLNGVWTPSDTHLKMKLSTAYMWGQQNFDFYSGASNANLNQASYFLSAQYIVPKEVNDYLHSAGISSWGSKANQTNQGDPVYVVAQNVSAYQVIMDPRKLAVGTLQGASLDTQVGLAKQIVTKISLGYESLLFPFSDGTHESDRTVFQNYLIQYQPMQKVILQAGYKIGAAENNISLSAGYGQWLLTGFKNNGNNGVMGNQGLMLTYRIPLDEKSNQGALNFLNRPEDVGSGSYVLRDAFIRPVQLPQTFLAKVDMTAVKTVVNINKLGLPNGVSVNSAGDILATVGAGGGSITGVTRNGGGYGYSSTIQMSGTQVIIHTKFLPAPANGGDTYAISVTDSTSTPYTVTITAAP